MERAHQFSRIDHVRSLLNLVNHSAQAARFIASNSKSCRLIRASLPLDSVNWTSHSILWSHYAINMQYWRRLQACSAICLLLLIWNWDAWMVINGACRETVLNVQEQTKMSTHVLVGYYKTSATEKLFYIQCKYNTTFCRGVTLRAKYLDPSGFGEWTRHYFSGRFIRSPSKPLCLSNEIPLPVHGRGHHKLNQMLLLIKNSNSFLRFLLRLNILTIAISSSGQPNSSKLRIWHTSRILGHSVFKENNFCPQLFYRSVTQLYIFDQLHDIGAALQTRARSDF